MNSPKRVATASPVNSAGSSRRPFETDFIVVAEFSELVGPVCLQVIPEMGAGLFDIPTFVLKIMSVDHQARSGESGVFAEDTVVVFFEPLEEAWCYVHHLTLLDIHARGYVRPICFTYATRDNQKLMGNFKSLFKHFTEISNILKTGNYQLFRDDLKKRMADLAYTKGVVDTMEGASMVTAATPGIITRHFEDMQKMRTKMKQQASLVLSPENSLDDVDITSFIRTTTPVGRKGSSSTAIPTLDSDDDDDMVAGTARAPASAQRRLFDDGEEDGGVGKTGEREEEDEDEEPDEDDHLGEIMVNIVRALGIDRDYKPRVIQSLHKSRTLSSTLRTLRELCGAHYDPAMAKMERVRQHYSRSNLALMLEAEEVAILSPACSALVGGGVPLLNFNWQADHQLLLGMAVGGARGTSASETSEDDYDFKSFTAQSAHLSNELFDQTMAYAHTLVMAARGGPGAVIAPGAAGSIGDGSSSASFNVGSRLASSANFVGLSGSGKHLLVVDAQHTPIRLEDLLPLGTNEGIASKLWMPALLQEPAQLPRLNVSSDGSEELASRGGSEALLLRRFSFSKQALFSMLKGRPLIVHGQSQEVVAQFVSAFRLVAVFCVGSQGWNAWLPRPPRMSDLSQLVLMGLSKAHKIPASVQRYVSVLDVDAGTLDAPPYTQGRLLEGICDPSRRWQSPEPYLAFVYAELAEMATLSCLYYYTCCVGVPMDTASGEDESLLVDGRFTPNTVGTTFRKSLSTQQTAPLMEQDSNLFWKEHRLSFCDAQIVQYFCEVIKQQQCQEMYGGGGGGGAAVAAPLVKLDFSKCERFSDTFGMIGFGSGSQSSSNTPQRTPKSSSATGPSSMSKILSPKNLFK